MQAEMKIIANVFGMPSKITAKHEDIIADVMQKHIGKNGVVPKKRDNKPFEKAAIARRKMYDLIASYSEGLYVYQIMELMDISRQRADNYIRDLRTQGMISGSKEYAQPTLWKVCGPWRERKLKVGEGDSPNIRKIREEIVQIIEKIEPCYRRHIQEKIPHITNSALGHHLNVLKEQGFIDHPPGNKVTWVVT